MKTEEGVSLNYGNYMYERHFVCACTGGQLKEFILLQVLIITKLLHVFVVVCF